MLFEKWFKWSRQKWPGMASFGLELMGLERPPKLLGLPSCDSPEETLVAVGSSWNS